MRFRIAEDDAALAGAAAALLAKEATAREIRAGWPGGDTGRVDAVWRRLAAIGALGTLVPDSADGPGSGLGLGLDENALVPLLVELGRSGLPVPAVETVAVGAPLLAAAGSPHLAEVLAGRLLLTASLDGSGLVPFGQRAPLLVLRADDGLRLYERGELALEPVESTDGSRASARLLRPPDGGGQLLCTAPEELERAWQRGVLGTAALLVGLAERMIELTVDHVQQRRQFGAPVGSFQAVQHALADAHLAVRFARPAVLAAAWSQASSGTAAEAASETAAGADAAVVTSMAKVLASDAARLVARTAIQCHGAIGCTTEYDLHLYAKRAWALAAAWGGPAAHRELIARHLHLPTVEMIRDRIEQGAGFGPGRGPL
ncbi:acyl-CoA dehydrogenase [Streptacidiphilus sp. PB12-B1b]|uniref:acyl-CoA dehydrogenase family protein n=1 Tax=Streptacidiphilus sp. PB12-B1b TaxID=2705012 RepID=UPI0015F9765F|nr:acyl-CoA dehydrogenase family protein [Streptacidiphilus sp. PB12-B1b]QMU77772.1 acyl-CoA dehydrogenase [Streptacidiphilus sp. PB12-B1b]